MARWLSAGIAVLAVIGAGVLPASAQPVEECFDGPDRLAEAGLVVDPDALDVADIGGVVGFLIPFGRDLELALPPGTELVAMVFANGTGEPIEVGRVVDGNVVEVLRALAINDLLQTAQFDGGDAALVSGGGGESVLGSVCIVATGAPVTTVEPPVTDPPDTTSGPVPTTQVAQPGGGNGDGPDILVYLLVALAIALAVTATIAWRRFRLKARWQAQADDGDLPDTCRKGQRHCKRDPLDVKPQLRSFRHVGYVVRDAVTGVEVAANRVAGDVVDRLNDALAARRVRRPDDQRAGVAAAAAALAELLRQVVPAAGTHLSLTARYEGTEASADFTLYRCTGSATPPRWQQVMSWTAKYHDAADLGPGGIGPVDATVDGGQLVPTLTRFVDTV